MSTLFPNVPAMTREAQDPEMEQLGFDAKSALEAAQVGGATYLSRMKEAGEHLTKAKRKCPHGQWISWLAGQGISRSRAYRALRAFDKHFNTHRLDDAIADLGAAGEETEKVDPSSQPAEDKKFCSRDCRVGKGPKKCKECAKLNKVVKPPPPPPPPPGPATPPETPATTENPPELSDSELEASRKLASILVEGEEWEKLAKRARRLSKKIRKVERSDLYRMATGVKSERFSDAVLKVANALPMAAPKEPCPACRGAVAASVDSEPCGGCRGKGFLIGEEVALRTKEEERSDS